MLRVTQRTLAGRLFQIVEAAVRKPRVPNGTQHRVTDNRFVWGDLHGSTWDVPVEQAGN